MWIVEPIKILRGCKIYKEKEKNRSKKKFGGVQFFFGGGALLPGELDGADTQTWQLLDQIGPGGRVGEKQVERNNKLHLLPREPCKL